MTIRELTDLRELEQIYRERMTEDFPRNELKPFAMIRRAMEREEYAAFGLYEGEELLGYALFWKDRAAARPTYLFDYYAIEKHHRDEGLGSRFLSLLAETFAGAECVVGEVEDPEQERDPAARETQQRRLDFYLRNGLHDPGVTARVYGVNYRVLELPLGAVHSDDEIRSIYSDIYRRMLPAAFYQRHFHLDRAGEENP